MKTIKIPAVEFKKTIKGLIKDNPKMSPNGRGIGSKLKDLGFLSTKDLQNNGIKAGRCSQYEITIGRGQVVYTNLKTA